MNTLIDEYIQANQDLFDSIYKKESPRVISHILIKCEDPDNPTKEEKAKMTQVEEALKEDGATFAKVAQKYSEDTGSAENGGSLGICLKSDSLDASFAKAAWKLKAGETSKWVKSAYGYHLIYIDTTSKEDMFKDQYKDSMRSIISQNTDNLSMKVVWEKAEELGLEISDEDVKKELMEYCGIEAEESKK